MKVNYDFYTGQDTYCDGEVEKDIINYLKEQGEENYQKIFKKDVRWPVFYNITPIRKNIVNWYPFKENSEVLEIGAGMGAITGILCNKAKQVTSVELSKQRASAIQARCQDKENLEIIVGNFNDIKFDKKFDYITLIGVLEYAPVYTNTDNPFHDFLVQIKSLLKEDGKLLIAIENQYGMKYFTGIPEDHTAKVYDGIIGYENKKGIRTFGKKQLKEILGDSGLPNTKFYYPMPDYKLPNVIFSDAYQPNEDRLEKYTPYSFEENKSVAYDEKRAYLDIIKNDQFDFFANSFFVEAGMQEFETEVDLSKQDLIKIDSSMKPFYEKHYQMGKSQEDTSLEKQLLQENQRLKEELYAMANSKSWKLTKPLRDFTNKLKK